MSKNDGTAQLIAYEVQSTNTPDVRNAIDINEGERNGSNHEGGKS